jgi:hypothetical protein
MNEILEPDTDLLRQIDKTTMVADLQRAEIDIQVATAHKYPRSLTKVSRNIKSLATISRSAAEECMYALPRGNKPITGPSIRLAEIVFSQWGNCRGGARVVHVDKQNGFVEAEGIFHDLETNSATTKRVRRRIFDKNGRCFNDDMILVTGNAACSIAFRNAVIGGVPKAIWDEAYQAALATMKGDIKTLPERREQALKAMAAFGMTADQVWKVLGIHGERECGLEQLVILGGMHNSLREGDITVEALLAESGVETKPNRNAGDVVRKPAAKPEQTKEEPGPDVVDNDEAPATDETQVEQVEQKEEEKAREEAKTSEDDNETWQKWRSVGNTMIAEMMDDVEEVMNLYGPQLPKMQAEAPDVWRDVMQNAEEFRKAAEDDASS